MQYRCMTTLLATTFVLWAVACGGPASSPPSPRGGASSNGVVSRGGGGDTIVVRFAGKHQETVRLIGIDTPESVKPNTPVQCYALEASARTKAMLPAGTPVRLMRDAEARDRYGRLLAYVYRATDDMFVNLALARDG